jgi:hypothetical protein
VQTGSKPSDFLDQVFKRLFRFAGALLIIALVIAGVAWLVTHL